MTASTDFPEQLRSYRKQARRSQMDLALEAGVSQRHLSFLESGRAKPGRAVVEKLARALELPAPCANAFMESAGYAALFPAYAWSDEAMAPIRQAADELLVRHAPYPAILIDASANVIKANRAFDAALSLIDAPERLWALSHPKGEPRNLLRLSLHPDGTAKASLNFETVAYATLQRARREARGAPPLETLLEEIRQWPNIDPAWLEPGWGPSPAPIIEERFQVGGDVLTVFAVITTLGAPLDASPLRIESYFPADATSRTALTRAGADRNSPP
jgi:transcriptional regulator with XRE-family HTH domain